MKYFAIFFISFLLAAPVYAAKIVPGTVPEVQPLQPPAAGIGSNFNKNIQSQDTDHTINQDAGTQQAPADQASVGGNPATQNIPAKQSHVILWIIIVLAVLGGGYWVLRRNQ